MIPTRGAGTVTLNRALVCLVVGALAVGALAACSSSAGSGAGGGPAATVPTAPAVSQSQRAKAVSDLGVDGGVISGAQSLAAAANSDTADLESAAAEAAGRGSGAGAAVCAAVPAAQVSALVGALVGKGVVSGSADDQCTWTAGGGGSARIQVLAAGATRAQTGTPVPGVKGDSYVVQLLGGWVAGASTPTKVVVVFLTGPKASASTAGGLLRLAPGRV